MRPGGSVDLRVLDSEAVAQALRAMCALLKQFADDFMPLTQRLAFVAIPEPELRVRPAL